MSTKPDSPSRTKRRRESVSVAPYPPPRKDSTSLNTGHDPAKTALYIPSLQTSTSNLFTNNFSYPSPSSTSPSSCTDLLDCSANKNYVNPADLFNSGSFQPQNFPTPTSASTTSSIFPPTPEFTTYMPSFSSSSKDLNSTRQGSIDYNDLNSLMNSLNDPSSVYKPPPMDDNSLLFNTADNSFSPQQFLYPDVTSPASFTNDSGFQSAHSNTPFQFAWQSTTRSHGSNEYNTSLPFEPSHSSTNPIDIIMKQGSKMNSGNPFAAQAIHNAQLFAQFPDINDVFDLLIDQKGTDCYTFAEIVDTMLRDSLIVSIQSAGIAVPELPVSADLSTYVSAYWELIHPHLPILFKPGFVAQFAPEGSLLGMCALGALTLNSERHARALNAAAKAVVKDVPSFLKSTNPSDETRDSANCRMCKGCSW